MRDLQLELRVGVRSSEGEYSIGILKDAVAEEKASGGFDFDGVLSEPLVTFYLQGTCPK